MQIEIFKTVKIDTNNFEVTGGSALITLKLKINGKSGQEITIRSNQLEELIESLNAMKTQLVQNPTEKVSE